jgi:hypothetical protein
MIEDPPILGHHTVGIAVRRVFAAGLAVARAQRVHPALVLALTRLSVLLRVPVNPQAATHINPDHHLDMPAR